jgi:subtilisin family serine protease
VYRTPSQRGRQRSDRPKRPDYVPGQIVIRLEEDAVANVADVSVSTTRLESVRMPDAIEAPLAALRRKQQIHDVEPVFARTRTSARLTAERAPRAMPRAASFAAAFAASVRDSESERLRGINVLTLAKSADTAQVARELSQTPGIAYAHQVPARWPAMASPSTTADPLVNRQWGLRAIRWFDAKRPDASAVKVGVLDTGIDAKHPDLAAALTFYDRNVQGAKDIVGHGTHVAGIIAAVADNAVGIAGIAACDLSVWKIFPDTPAPDGEFYVDQIAYLRALNACRTAGIRVVNLSIGGYHAEETEATVFRLLIETGTLVVAAMGNEYEDGNPTEYPAAYDNVLAVGATNESDRRAYFSNTGRHIGLVAPGMNILSTLPRQRSIVRGDEDTEYAAWNGTSMATPHVTAAAALLFAKYPSWDGSRVSAKLKRTATKVLQMRGRTRTDSLGAGLLNLKQALS